MESQSIRFATAPDGVRLAWTVTGAGPPLVRAATWLTHLEYDWESPAWRHWLAFFSGHFRTIRYDERGNGLSQHDARDLSPACWETDLATVIGAARPETPFTLIGISQGAAPAIAYAARHPENVERLIIYGGYTRGWKTRNDPELEKRWQAIIDLTEIGWGKPDPTFRRLYTAQFLPEGSEAQRSWMDDLCRRTTSPANAAELMRSRGQVDVSDALTRVQVPTLVVHAKNDEVVGFGEGLKIASGIPGAEFVQLDSRNHILLEDEPAWTRFQQVMLEFTGRDSAGEADVFSTLSERERAILAKLSQGLSNADIGEALFISEKTVRNHITRIYAKLGVNSRAQAIVLARDGGFRAGIGDSRNHSIEGSN